ncbi:hypothetical protein N9O88_00990 [bacterium]|nr:hypothetical protein [bacterium]
MTYNKLYIDQRFPYYKNIDNNNNFIISNKNHPSYNFDEYIVCQELYNYKGLNASYYYSFICNSIFNNGLSVKREEIYHNIQKFNISFSKLILLIKKKYKKSKNVQNVLLEDFKLNNMKIIHNNYLFIFDYFEIYKIVKESFFFNTEKECKKIIIKNPYTNKKFDYPILIQIYFQLLNYGKVPEMFFLYFKSNFSSNKLKENYLINLYINNFKNDYINLTFSGKLKFISSMLQNTDGKEYENFNNLSSEIKFNLFENITLNYYLELQIESFFFTGYECISDNYRKKYESFLMKIKSKNPFLGRKIIQNKKYSIMSNFII